MTHGRRTARRRRRSPLTYLAVIATLAGVVAGLYFVGSTVFASDDDPGPGIGLSMIPPPASPGETARGGNVDRATGELADRCGTELAAGEELIAVAQDGVDHWAAHIQARTDGMAGKITGEEMRAIWKETKLPGPDDVAAFEEASAQYTGVAGACHDDDTAPGTLPAECVTRSDLLAAAAETAHAVIDEWDAHLANMAKFADGGMTATEAQEEWEEAWATAPDNLQAHANAISAVQDGPECELTEAT